MKEVIDDRNRGVREMITDLNVEINKMKDRYREPFTERCDVCGSTDVMEVPHMGMNCNDCHPLSTILKRQPD